MTYFGASDTQSQNGLSPYTSPYTHQTITQGISANRKHKDMGPLLIMVVINLKLQTFKNFERFYRRFI